MAENKETHSKGGSNSGAYILFLILILLIMSSRNTFNSYFELLDSQISTLNNMFSAFSNTASGLKALFQTNVSKETNGVELQ